MVHTREQMIFDRDKQTLILDGKKLTAQDIATIKSTDVEMPLHDIFDFLQRWFDPSDCIAVHTSGSTDTPKTLQVEKSKMMQSARLTCEYLGLKEGDSALLCMNLRYIGAMPQLVSDCKILEIYMEGSLIPRKEYSKNV